MPIQLTARRSDSLPINVANVTPNSLRGLEVSAVRQQPIRRGNQAVALSDLFDVSGPLGKDTAIEWRGDLHAVHFIGAKMLQGTMIVHGNAGRHLASGMQGGTLIVHGNVGDYAASRLAGGLVRIHGNAGDWAGGSYENENFGMRGGELIVDGSTGAATGARMRRGLIYVGGGCGNFLGNNMRAGTIVVAGDVSDNFGVGMRRGTLILSKPTTVATSYAKSYSGNPIALRLLNSRLARLGISVNLPRTDFEVFAGDLTLLGRGEIFVGRGQKKARLGW